MVIEGASGGSGANKDSQSMTSDEEFESPPNTSPPKVYLKVNNEMGGPISKQHTMAANFSKKNHPIIMINNEKKDRRMSLLEAPPTGLGFRKVGDLKKADSNDSMAQLYSPSLQGSVMKRIQEQKSSEFDD